MADADISRRDDARAHSNGRTDEYGAVENIIANTSILEAGGSAEALHAIVRLRREAQDEIDRLLAFLDKTELDPDLEPSLGSQSVDLREPAAVDAEGEDADVEPDLGATEDQGQRQDGWGRIAGEAALDGEHTGPENPNQFGRDRIKFRRGETDDDEDGHDAEQDINDEPQGPIDDYEPSLGWTIDGANGNCEDLEQGFSIGRQRMQADRGPVIMKHATIADRPTFDLGGAGAQAAALGGFVVDVEATRGLRGDPSWRPPGDAQKPIENIRFGKAGPLGVTVITGPDGTRYRAERV